MRWLMPLAILAMLPLAWGAEPEAPRLLSPADAAILAYADASELSSDVASTTRYLWLPNMSAKERLLWRAVLSGHCNQLSTRPRLIPVRPIADGHLLAIDIREYGWQTEVWEKFAETDPTFSALVVTEIEELKEVTTTVEVDWPGGVWPKDGKFYARGAFIWVKSVVKRVPSGTKVRKVARAAAPWLSTTPAQKEAIARLSALTESAAPIVNAIVFLDSTGASGDGRNPDYYAIQGVKDEKAWLKLVGADIEQSVAFTPDMLAAISVSGVTRKPRAIQHVEKIAGSLFSSYDVLTAKDDKNALRIIGTDGKGKPTLNFDASEKYAHGANGLWKFLLVNNKGVLQPAAPSGIAQDKQEIIHNSHDVIVCVSCIRCHAKGGLQDLSDYWRNFPPELNPILGSKKYDREEFDRLRDQYGRRLEPVIKAGRDRYEAALLEATEVREGGRVVSPGMKSEEFATAFSDAWRYAADSQVDLEWISRETGRSVADCERAIRAQLARGKADPVLSGLLLPPARRQPIDMEQWRQAYGLMQTYLLELKP